MLGTALLLAGCASPSPPETADELAAERGRDLAVAQCAGCHSIGLKGASGYRAAPALRTLRGHWTGVALQLRLEHSPIHASADMPARRLTPAQADDLAAFIASVRAGRPPPGAPLRAPICNPMLWC